MIGDVLANSVQELDETKENDPRAKGRYTPKMVENALEATKLTLDDIAMPIVGSKIS